LKALVREDDGKFRVIPICLGVSGIIFKKKSEAECLARALDDAHERGRQKLQGELRELLGAAAPQEPDEDA
jgi:hypothetical protein